MSIVMTKLFFSVNEYKYVPNTYIKCQQVVAINDNVMKSRAKRYFRVEIYGSRDAIVRSVLVVEFCN